MILTQMSILCHYLAHLALSNNKKYFFECVEIYKLIRQALLDAATYESSTVAPVDDGDVCKEK